MREQILGRSPRLTAYCCGLAVGLALLVAGLEATRVGVVALDGFAFALYASAGALAGVVLAFVVGYLNGSVLASWAMGVVPAAGRVGDPLASGAVDLFPDAILWALWAGVLLGTVGFVVAVAKHRRDALTADLPDPPSVGELVGVVALSALLAGALFAAGAAV